MRKLSVLGAFGALLLGATSVFAAGSGPRPLVTTPPKSAMSTIHVWSATFTPAGGLSGEVWIREFRNKTGIVIIKADGLKPGSRWTVDVDGGTLSKILERVGVVQKSGTALHAGQTLRIRLTQSEMRAFLRDRKADGVVVQLRDATHLAEATFPA